MSSPTDRKDCVNCKRIDGMKLMMSWHSVTEPGMMHIRWECETCHARDWENLAIAETK